MSKFDTWPGHCIVVFFLAKHFSYSASFQPGVYIFRGKLSENPDEMLMVTL